MLGIESAYHWRNDLIWGERTLSPQINFWKVIMRDLHVYLPETTTHLKEHYKEDIDSSKAFLALIHR